jgi:hypothetical protein
MTPPRAIVPLAAGTLVKGIIGDLAIRSQCRGHVWRTTEAFPSNWSSGSGWVQAATCLVCEYTTAPMDAEWWQELASPGDVAGAAQAVLKEMGRLRLVYENLTASMSAGQVQTVGDMNFE